MSFNALLALLLSLAQLATGCGVLTHAEICYRALTRFFNPQIGTRYRDMLSGRLSYLLAGAFFPDWYRGCVHFRGYPIGLSEESEYAHWMRFYKHAFEHIQRKYPKPWSPEAKDFIAFVFGAISHQVADVDWHGLQHRGQSIMHAIGVKNMMPAWTYDAAHSMADIFGEFQLGRVSDVDYGAVQHRRIHFKMPSWQTPFEDLQDIYRRSGYSEVTRTELIKGMGLGFIGYRAGPTFRGSIFRSYGGQCPVFVEHYEDYPSGGINHLITQVMVCWTVFAGSLESGTLRWCPHMEHFMHKYAEQDQRLGLSLLAQHAHQHLQEAADPTRLWSITGAVKDATGAIGSSIGSVMHTVSDWWAKTHKGLEHALQKEAPDESRLITELWLETRSPYAGFGEALAVASSFGGRRVLLIGAPRWTATNGDGFQAGAVLAYDATASLKAPVILRGGELGAQFGTSIAIVDLDGNGQDDLVVSAPFATCRNSPQHVCGRVHVYLNPSLGSLSSLKPDLTISAEAPDGGALPSFFGHALASGDLDGDGHADLVIGSPYMQGDRLQAGRVHVLLSSRSSLPRSEVHIDSLSALTLKLPAGLQNSEGFDWFGWTASVIPVEHDKRLLVISAPGHSEGPTLKDAGAVLFYEFTRGSCDGQPKSIIVGTDPLGQFGHRVELMLNGWLAVSSPSQAVGQKWQAGCVYFFPVDQLVGSQLRRATSELAGAQVCGGDMADHFGWAMAADRDRLLIGARSANAEAGAVYTVNSDSRLIEWALNGASSKAMLVMHELFDCESVLVVAQPSASSGSSAHRTGSVKLYCHS